MEIAFYPEGVRNPFINEIKSHQENLLVFDGYFYSNELPVQRIMVQFGEMVTDETGATYRSMLSSSHIELFEVSCCDDTAILSGDDKSGFFPTEITTIKYKILKSDLSDMEFEMLMEVISEDEKERDKIRLENIMKNIDE